MQGLAVSQQNNTQVLAFALNPNPFADAAIGLDQGMNRVGDGGGNPFIPDQGPVGAQAGVKKILRGLHLAQISTRSFSTRRLSMMKSWRSGVFLPMKKLRSSSEL